MATTNSRRPGELPRVSVLAPQERILNCILVIRRKRVIPGTDLAALFGVSTKALHQTVKRNIDRFPPDFRADSPH